MRLYCIDAPEMDEESWGQLSRDYLRRITPRRITIATHDGDLLVVDRSLAPASG